MKIVSWNVNGIRAAYRKGFLEWLKKESPDLVGVQEIKAKENQLPAALLTPPSYHAYFNPAERPGYSGTAIYTKKEPLKVGKGLGAPEFDSEGRVISADFGDFIFLNIYFPNGKAREERLKFKLDFYDSALDYFETLVSAGRELIIAGDYNTAHTEIDLARPKENEHISGFLPVERAWLDRLTAHGYVDAFRQFEKGPDHYTWWSQRSGARERNVGWRIDYFFTSPNLAPKLKSCYHLPHIHGSDHCPIVLEI